MFHLVQSKDMREYMEKQGRTLTDFEKAVLIYHHAGISLEERAELLADLKVLTGNRELKKQIQERLDYERRCFALFFEKRENMIYSLEILNENSWEEYGYFTTGELAVSYGKKFQKRFSVCKTELIAEEKDLTESGVKVVSTLTFDDRGKLAGCWSYEVEWCGEKDEGDKTRFENAYVELPHFFRTGDLVRAAGMDDIGIVLEEPKSMSHDYSDCSIRVEYIGEDGKFVHDHVPLTALEHADLEYSDPKKEVLKSAQLLLQGKGSFQTLQKKCEELKKWYDAAQGD